MEAINLAAFGLTFLLSLAVAAGVLRSGAISLWDGFLYADSLSALVILLSASVALVCAVYAVGYLREDERSGALDEESGSRESLAKLRKYYALTPLFVFSMLLVTVANNLGVMWAAIELTTLASVFLVTFYGKVTSIEAAWKYAIIGGVGLSMALFGTIVTYYAGHKLPGSEGLSGLNWSVLVGQAAHLDRTSMRLAFVLVLLGYGTKAGLAPMHTWKPDAYSEAPVPSAAILSTALLNCALYGLVRFYALTKGCLGAEYPGNLLLLLGIFSMGISVPFVLVQKNFRRLLAYSTIDQAGIMVTALGIGGKIAALALMLHMTFHTIAKSLLFLCAGNIYQRFRTDLFARIKGGVIGVMPLTGIAFFMASAGDRRDAAVQPVSERIPDGRRGLCGRPLRAGPALHPVRYRSLRGNGAAREPAGAGTGRGGAHRLVPVAGFGRPGGGRRAGRDRLLAAWAAARTDPRRRPHRGGE